MVQLQELYQHIDVGHVFMMSYFMETFLNGTWISLTGGVFVRDSEGIAANVLPLDQVVYYDNGACLNANWETILSFKVQSYSVIDITIAATGQTHSYLRS